MSKKFNPRAELHEFPLVDLKKELVGAREGVADLKLEIWRNKDDIKYTRSYIRALKKRIRAVKKRDRRC